MATILLSVVLVGVAFGLLAIRLLSLPDGEFRGTCATNNPYLDSEPGECTLCGKSSDEPCQRWSPRRWARLFNGHGQG